MSHHFISLILMKVEGVHRLVEGLASSIKPYVIRLVYENVPFQSSVSTTNEAEVVDQGEFRDP